MQPNEPHRLIKAVSVFIFIALFLSLFLGMGPNLSSRLVSMGERIWPGYAKDLRQDPQKPDCIIEEIEKKLSQCQPVSETKANDTDDEDPFAEEEEDPFAEEEKDPFAEEEDPFAEEEDPFAEEEDPFAEEEKDPFAEEEEDPFAEKTPKRAKVTLSCEAITNLKNRCEVRQADYASITDRITPSVVRFRSVETFLSNLAKFPYWKHMLAILTLLGAFAASLRREHIALRLAKNQTEERISQTTQIIALLLWLYSNIRDYGIRSENPELAEDTGLPLIWGFGFAILILVSAYHLTRSNLLPKSQASVSRMFMVVPLYTYMGIIAGVYFLVGEQHPSGMAIYLHKFAQVPNIYLGIGLYIWAGMLFATTRIAKLFFDILLPWRLPVSILAWLVVVLAAFPTAYSGASGIFVIAAGAVIFDRLMIAGASKRLALAATAMSGSLGVVLRPCLVVVLIAILNKQVTTDVLFENGFLVFGLTALLLLIAMLIRNKEPWKIAPAQEALPKSKEAVVSLLPYLMVAAVVFFAYGFGLATWINEHTAPLVLPGILLTLVVYERVFLLPRLPEEAEQKATWPTLVGATNESSTHIGALLMVMAASVGLGGVVERAEVMNYFPADFGSPVLAMSALVFIMVLVGMTMDALGAVVLVSVTLAGVAYENQIDPVHFWMMVLVAFELGYLTPPVAINHLLARQVIGADAEVEDDGTEGFWAKNEHILLPMSVMGIALILVAYVPFLFY